VIQFNEDSNNYLLKARIRGGNSWTCSSNSDGEIRSKSDMCTRNKSKLENIRERFGSFPNSCCNGSLVERCRRLNDCT
jgi:hypothetical protein